MNDVSASTNALLRDVEESMKGELSSNALITVKLPEAWKTTLAAIAQRTNTTISQVVRKIMEPYFISGIDGMGNDGGAKNGTHRGDKHTK